MSYQAQFEATSLYEQSRMLDLAVSGLTEVTSLIELIFFVDIHWKMRSGRG